MPRPSCRLSPLLMAGLLLEAACSSQNAANSPVSALSTVSAVVVGGTLAPVGEAFHAISGSDRERRLSYPAVYLLRDGTIAIANRSGWFTDRSEFAKAGQAGQSAWVIDLKRAPRNADGVIVLTDKNLDRWFFREHRKANLRLILYEGPLAEVNVTTGDRIQMGPDHHSLTLLLGGEAYRFTLTQDKVDTPDTWGPTAG